MCWIRNSVARRLYVRPNQLVTAERAPFVKSVLAGTSSGLFGFLLMSVIVSLLQAAAPARSATTMPDFECSWCILRSPMDAVTA